MKGIVFVKFNDFVEEQWGEEFWDELLTEATLPSEGVFTTIGSYDDEEFYTLLGLIVKKKNISGKEAQFAFGKWLFKELYASAPPQAHAFKDVFEFLHGVQNVIHLEVKKLNPDALLPEFEFIDESATELTFHYKSPRKLCYFCEGLVHGLAEHTGQTVKVSQPECEHDGGQRCLINVEKI
ncbi:MAG: putative hydrocarbon binding protein [Paraglaciecola sp.]|jgi:predicted hydrocarbon binding protein